MKLNLNIGPLGPDGTIKLQAFVALARQGPQGIQGPQGEQGPGIAPDDPRLTDAREWTASTVDQTEAEAGTATTRRAWTAQRVRQAMLGWWGGFAAKATPVDADSIVIADSAASDAPKRLTWANAVAKLKGTFVEGPASAIDGQVMVFDGVTGKKSKTGGALGGFAFASFSDIQPPNLLSDCGKFAGAAKAKVSTVALSDFSNNALFWNTYGAGTSVSAHSIFKSNNSTYGGTDAALSAECISLLDASGWQPGVPRRYGNEFIIMKIAAGTLTLSPYVHNSVTYYQLSRSSMTVTGTSLLSYGFWAKTDTDAVINSSDNIVTTLTPDDGWKFVSGTTGDGRGISMGNPIIYTKTGANILIAMPTLTNGKIILPPHKTPSLCANVVY